MQALAKKEVGDFLTKHFVAVYDRVGSFEVNVQGDGTKARRNGGNVAAFFCTPSGHVIHAVAGPRTAEAFLAEAKWTVAAYDAARNENRRVDLQMKSQHAAACQTMQQPNPFAPNLELIFHEPSLDPSLNDLERNGLDQRKRVHTLLQIRAFEPLETLGPVVYTTILGERVTDESVRVTGSTEGGQAAGAQQSIADFLSSGGSSKLPPPEKLPPSTPPSKKSDKGSKRATNASKQDSRR